MNYAIVFRLLGYVMLIEGALLLLPAAASWIYGEWFVLGVFLITAAVSAAIGYALRGIKPKSKMPGIGPDETFGPIDQRSPRWHRR